MDKNAPAYPNPPALLERIVEILKRHHLMTVATLRSDGWPQATIVNYAPDGLRLYFVVSTQSQKLSNLRRDQRVSIAIGGAIEGPPVGLSMAARVGEVSDLGQISALNDKLWTEQRGEGFTPHPTTPGSVLLVAEPIIVSLIDYDGPKAWPRLFKVEPDWRLVPISQPNHDLPEARS
ncbi:pyridoxamine 5'-phosphate oxidase [Caulobacter zeae]|uniref:Pyridoxamine 5'-phosphate oxidase n=1 Tax=Caulobacter zeae TaxID=2055137 RepID=A0A2N5DRF9_9CAUL|nr:pyridoxamine 5'-phosphate oxidase family protein [Caulobacter zeae]PLR28628.1 pyridoxamine 5'-phosphate oxidase [Caulobacter zeae]